MPEPARARVRIALIHALAHSAAPMRDAVRRLWPACEPIDCLDTGLSAARAAHPEWPVDAFTERVVGLADAARARGASGLLFTCSAFGPCIAEAARRHPDIPVLGPTEAMVTAAAAAGVRVGLIATFAPTVESLVREFPVATSLQSRLAAGALEALDRGDTGRHDACIADTAALLVQEGCGVIALAQVSMASAAPVVAARCAVPVLTTPDSAVRLLRTRLQRAGREVLG